MSNDAQSPLLSLRLRFHDHARLGPGKIALLEAVHTHGSVAAAGASMDMSARRAWLLIDSLNKAFTEPVVAVAGPENRATAEAVLTSLGHDVVTAYRQVEADAASAVGRRFATVLTKLASVTPDTSPD